MKFTYFPGCSLKGSGRAYEESLLAVCKQLGVELEELDDWNCCGATAYMAVSERQAFGLAARNLALAEQQPHGLLAPCSACYMVLKKTQKYLVEYPQIGQEVHDALSKGGLKYAGTAEVRHPLDVLVNNVGLDAIKKQVKMPLKGFKVAPYYGCQIVRPYADFDDQHDPVLMDKLFKALGAEVVKYPLKTRCCGGSLTGTLPEAGLGLSFHLLREAQRRGANVLATVCPLCQFNLDAYQREMSSKYEPVHMPIVYFTQLMGLAFGLDKNTLGLQRGIISIEPLLKQQEVAA
jgi:heterodisulfide reductase subunit B